MILSGFNIETVRKTELEKTKEARDNFLKLSYSPNFNLPIDYKKKYFIYLIKNIENNKLYVGKCRNIFDRANNYIWMATDPERRNDRKWWTWKLCC